MRYLLLVFCFVLMRVSSQGQITIKTNLPEQVSTGAELLFEVRIQKGSLKNFSKYQMLVPEGIEIREVDSKTGTFTFEGNRAQIIWAITPPETELLVSMKFISGEQKGPKTINQKFFYLERGEKREVETQDITINVEDTASAGKELVPSEKEFVSNDLTNVTRDSISDNPEEVKQQISQLRRDSKEAYEIGGREKRNAEARLGEANKAIKAALEIKNPKEKKIATDKALASKTQAQNDLEVATRILSLAKSLEENADEIEKLNQSIDSIGAGGAKPTAGNTIVEKERSSEPAKPADGKTPPAKDTKGIYKPIEANSRNLGEIQQQVMQIKRDSRQAYEVGKMEKQKAEQKLAEANEALKMAGYMPEVEEKKVAIDKANADKARAQKDLEVAAKILALAKQLENNAKDIEGLSKNAAASNLAQNATAAKTPPAETTKATVPVRKPVEKAPNIIVENAAKPTPNMEAPEPVAKKEDAKTAPAGEKGLVYRIQIGSFVNPPNKADFKPLGKVDVVSENGLYKALYGIFESREEASKNKPLVISKGFDGFVVAYQNGVRVK